MSKQKNYLTFEKVGSTSKTDIYNVLNTKRYVLGIIKWYSPWRKYCFFATSADIWDDNCLQEIVKFIRELMLSRKMEEIVDIDNRS